MTKTMETKDQILALLKERKRTTTELSEELDLAKSTVSQHLAELERMGHIEVVDNPFFKRTKYYAIRKRKEVPQISIQQFQYRIGLSLLVLLVASSFMYYLYSSTNSQVPLIGSASTPQTTTQTSTTQQSSPQITQNEAIGFMILGAIMLMSVMYLARSVAGLRKASSSKI